MTSGHTPLPDTPRHVGFSRTHSEGIDAKIVVLGNSGVGKTSLLHRYVQNNFDPTKTTATTSAFFAAKRVYLDNHKVRLQLWDTAGQERFRSMAPIYYRGANAALLLYDITNSQTFEDLRAWLQELKKNCSTDLIIYIVGAKADLYPQREVSKDRIHVSLHNWFPPPRPSTPPLPASPPAQSYIRPRFTSLTNLTNSTSVPFLSLGEPRLRTMSHSVTSSPTIAPDLTRKVLLVRSKTAATTQPAVRRNTPLVRRNTTSLPVAASPDENQLPSRSRSRRNDRQSPIERGRADCIEIKENEPVYSYFRFPDLIEFPKPVVEEITELEPDDETLEWGIEENMSLFEVSAKDDRGVQELFDSLIRAIIAKREIIEHEREMRERDSVYLSGGNVPTPGWAALADEEEARLSRDNRWGICC